LHGPAGVGSHVRQRVLLIEHLDHLRESISLHLELAGYTCHASMTSEHAIRVALDQCVDLIVIDVGIPSSGGLELSRTLRRHASCRRTPILIVTDLRHQPEALLALEECADDYLMTPIGALELVARARGLIRRSAGHLSRTKSSVDQEPSSLVRRRLVIDHARHRADVDGRPIKLTKQQFQLLWVLAEREGVVLCRETLLEQIWGTRTFVTTRSVDALVRRVRRSLQAVDRRSEYLVTVRGVGYKFESERTTAGPVS
jgi:DNA-binding response OmpR family regulator